MSLTPNGIETLPLSEYILIATVGRGEEKGNKIVDFYKDVQDAEESWESEIEEGLFSVRPAKLYEVVKRDIIETACMCKDGTILKAVDGHIVVHVKWKDGEVDVKLEKVRGN